MAVNDIELNFNNRLHLQSDTTHTLSGTGVYGSVGTLRTYLAASTAHGVGYYTSARLDKMTKNDMVYAARLIADPGTIK